MPIPTPKDGVYTYHTVSAGESLGYIALLYGLEVGELVRLNHLDSPEALIQVDQLLRIPVQTDKLGPQQMLLPDSEVVYGPSYANFDLAGFIARQQGYLASYSEFVDNQELSGAEIIERVAVQYSVGPRLLLALLEHYGGWVTSSTLTAEALNQPLGPHNPRGSDLYRALSFTANRVNAGYYGYKRDGFWIFELPDGSQAITVQGLNAGTVGVQNILAVHSDWESWQHELGPEGFMTTYRALFGEPQRYEVGPTVPINLAQPPLSLPWREGKGFYFTSGPHPAYVDGSAWAAVDFGPPDVLGNCFYSEEPITAAADGVVVSARQGEVYLDLDGDGLIQTGWVLFYLHVVLDIDIPVQAGQRLKQGDVVGYASCVGGLSNSSHLHFARRYNGEWLDAGGPVPMNLSGWLVQPNLAPYQGTMTKGSLIREACECWDVKKNLIVNTIIE
jgi:murein DD-endopeptidase MepM/ murein hydrolase activator NlpD